MLHHIRKTAALLTLFTCAAPALAYETYKVVGIAAGDTLVIREQPDESRKVADWKELGRIPSSATDVLGTGRSMLVGEQRWLEVAFGPARGWVNAKFIDSVDPADLKGATFSCAGTEPFWGITLGPEGGEYSDPEVEKTPLTLEAIHPAMARQFPLFYRLKAGNGRTYRATVSRQTWCTDGMSDFEYGFQIHLTDDEIFQEGCCSLKR